MEIENSPESEAQFFPEIYGEFLVPSSLKTNIRPDSSSPSILSLLQRRELDASLHRRNQYSTSPDHIRDQLYSHPYMTRRFCVSKIMSGHEGCVNSVSWDNSGEWLVSGSDDRKLILWQPFSPAPELRYKIPTDHHSNIFAAKFLSNDHLQLVSCSADGSVQYTSVDAFMQNSTSFQPIPTFQCHQDMTFDVHGDPLSDGKVFFSCSEDGTVNQYDLRIRSHCRCNACNQHTLIDVNALPARKRNNFLVKPPPSKSRMGMNGNHTSSFIRSMLRMNVGEVGVQSMDINPDNPFHIALGCTDDFVRIYDRRLLKTPIYYPEDYPDVKYPTSIISYRAQVYSFCPAINRESQYKFAIRIAERNTREDYELDNYGNEEPYEEDYEYHSDEHFDTDEYPIYEDSDEDENLMESSTSETEYNGNRSTDFYSTGNNGDEFSSEIQSEPYEPMENDYDFDQDLRQAHQYIMSNDVCPHCGNTQHTDMHEDDMMDEDDESSDMEEHEKRKHPVWASPAAKKITSISYDPSGSGQLLVSYSGYKIYRISPSKVKKSAWDGFTDEDQLVDVDSDYDDDSEMKPSAKYGIHPPVMLLPFYNRALTKEYDSDIREIYTGHRNVETMIKETRFLGFSRSTNSKLKHCGLMDFILSGSDDGFIYIWKNSIPKEHNHCPSHFTYPYLRIQADRFIVNCIAPNPRIPALAVSGIDPTVKLIEPIGGLGIETKRSILISEQDEKRYHGELEHERRSLIASFTLAQEGKRNTAKEVFTKKHQPNGFSISNYEQLLHSLYKSVVAFKYPQAQKQAPSQKSTKTSSEFNNIFKGILDRKRESSPSRSLATGTSSSPSPSHSVSSTHQSTDTTLRSHNPESTTGSVEFNDIFKGIFQHSFSSPSKNTKVEINQNQQFVNAPTTAVATTRENSNELFHQVIAQQGNESDISMEAHNTASDEMFHNDLSVASSSKSPELPETRENEKNGSSDET